MRVVVTGGAGFIGQHLVRRYLALGHEVLVLDDLSTGSSDGLPAGANLIRADVARPATAAAIAHLQPDVVIHAAAQISVTRSMEDPDRDRLVNLIGTQNVLQGSRDACRIVFLSSGGAIYGNNAQATETDVPQPHSYYAVHKWTAERYVALSGVSYAVARLANVYGPGQRADAEGGVVAIFCRRAQAGLPLTIYGDGQQRRDFVHVDDVVNAILAMGEAKLNGTWNVGSGAAITVNELADLVEKAAGRRLERRHAPARRGELRESCLDPSRIKSDLGWFAAISLPRGIKGLV